MAEQVGRIHVHDLPSSYKLDEGTVYRCHCNKEFFVGTVKDEYNDEEKGWWEVEGKLVTYDKTVGGKEFIGNWTPEIEFDEEVVDGQGDAEPVGEGVPSKDDGTSRTGEPDSE